MISVSTAVCLHAQSSDLKFLNSVKTRLCKILGSRMLVFELTDRNSQAEAVLALRKQTSGFVVIFAHGSGDYLRGGEYFCRTTGENVEVERFLLRSDLSAFRGKVVFCMSCDSNGLAQASLDSGATAFVGFDDIPFNRFDEKGDPTGSHVLVKHSQALIAEAIQAALERFITGRLSLAGSVDYLRLWIARHAITYVRQMEPKGVKERKEVAALFLKVKTGVRYHGPSDIFFRNDG